MAFQMTSDWQNWPDEADAAVSIRTLYFFYVSPTMHRASLSLIIAIIAA